MYVKLKYHILAGCEKKKNDIFSKQYSTRPLSYIQYTVKKRSAIFPSPAGMSLIKFSLPGIIQLFPARKKSLVSDIPAVDGKIDNLFVQVISG